MYRVAFLVACLILAGCTGPLGEDTVEPTRVEATTRAADENPTGTPVDDTTGTPTSTVTPDPTVTPDSLVWQTPAEPTVTEPARPEDRFPVPPGVTATYSPDPGPLYSADTENQAFATDQDPETVTRWYLDTLEGWELHTITEGYNPAWGWMNQLAYTNETPTMFVYVTSDGDGTEITISRGTGIVGIGRRYYPELGWGTVEYTVSPTPLADVSQVLALGAVNPPGHTFPTDHSYLFVPHENRPAPVVAPADGIVTNVAYTRFGDPAVDDYSVTIQHTNTHVTKLGHLSGLDPAFLASIGDLERGENEVAVRVDAGDPIGTAPMTYSTALDWWVFDETRHLDGFVHPAYYDRSVHAVSFLPYLSPDLAAAYEGRFTRDEPPVGGKIDFDVPGTLAGNWFLDAEPFSTSERSRQLAFVYGVHDHDDLRVSIGGTIHDPGRFTVVGNAPDPATVTPETGPVTYRLQHVAGTGEVRDPVVATVLVEVLGDERIRVEAFEGDVTDPTFTGDAVVYTR